LILTDMIKHEAEYPLNDIKEDLTEQEIQLLDEIDNVTQDYLSKLAELAGVKELPWDMSLIGEIKDVAIHELSVHGIDVPHPCVKEDD